MHNSAAPQTSLPHCFCFSSTPWVSLTDKHVTPANLHTHTHTRRSFAHFQHSWDVFVWVIPSCHSQLWIPSCPDTEPILKWFSHQASVWDKDLLEQTKNHLYPQSASSEFQLGRKEAGNRRSKFLSVHECWDPFFQAAHTLQFVVLTGAGGWSSRSSK